VVLVVSDRSRVCVYVHELLLYKQPRSNWSSTFVSGELTREGSFAWRGQVRKGA
jgi:hypothetical protein